MPLLSVRDLAVEFQGRRNTVRAVDGVSFWINHGETLAILGESGSGKSVTAQAIMGLLPRPSGRVVAGNIEFEGKELTMASASDMKAVRGAQISMIFQDPLSSLNPVHTVSQQIGEMLRIHRGLGKTMARQEAIELMERVRIPKARERADDYPHQFSGGMRQRIMIAMAIALRPKVIIADEPTTALDVTVQAQILDLLVELQREEDMALMLISHDLGLVASYAQRIAVMYAGRVVEEGPIREVYENPAHPYTEGLLRSVPDATTPQAQLVPIPGAPPMLEALPAGCPFHPRCAYRKDECLTKNPTLLPLHQVLDKPVAVNRSAACHRSQEVFNGNPPEASS